jgi:hypothetical protein
VILTSLLPACAVFEPGLREPSSSWRQTITVVQGGGNPTVAPLSALVLVVQVDTGRVGGALSPEAGRRVDWNAFPGGAASPISSTTDASGRAATTWRVGLAPGSYNLRAESAFPGAPRGAPGLDYVDFQATVGPHVLFSDDFEYDRPWTTRVTLADNTSTQVSTRVPFGGNPDGFLRMSYQWVQSRVTNQISVYHVLDAVYDPATGAIDSIAYSADRVRLTPFVPNVIQDDFVIVQADRGGDPLAVRYHVGVLDPSFRGFTNQSWERIRKTFVPGDFDRGAGVPKPDFGRDAPIMRFGYRRTATSTVPLTLEHGIDNWRVEIYRAP